MDYPCMICCRFPSISSRSEFRCPQNISPFKFLGQKISINPLRRGNNLGLFSVRPIIKRGSLKMTVSASSSTPNKGGGTEEEMQPKGSVDDECKGISSMLVERDHNAWNLGQKLEIIRDLVAESIDKDKRLEALTYSAIYLKWINTGQIPWSEDGGDDQPNKYAEISRRIFCHLERICRRKDISVQDILVIRKIHRCLSSFKPESPTFVLITRIEDVADRELKDFFNVVSLEKQLESVRDSLDQSSAALPRFLESKQVYLQQLDNMKDILDIAQDEWMTRLMNVLQALDNLRQEIVKGLESELQNDAPDAAITMRQKWHLCEIGLEEYSSLLLSRFLDSLEAVGGARWLAKHVEQKNVDSWNGPLGALIISIHQLGLSGWKPEECRAIGNELKAWQETSLLETEGGEDGTRIWGLRLKATLDRAERLTEEYSEALHNIFPEEKVQILGEAFGILKNSVRTYAEAEIRADVIFQVSYLCNLLLKAVREVVNARGWDILVPGHAFGKLIEVENIGSIPSSETEQLIVVVKKAEGDEEVKTAGPDIGGVILLQGLPRLSHLVLRARKENIVVMTCEDDELFKIRNLSEEDVMLVASSDGVSLTPFSLPTANSTESEPPVKPFEIYEGLPNSVGAMRIEDAETLARCVCVKAENICGTKAAACCRLASLAAESIQVKNDVGVPASFKVPKGAVIPFCSIQRALDIDKAKSSSYLSLVESIEKATPPDDTAALHGKLHELISSLSPSEEAIRELSNIFPDNAQLVLLPSASVEDLRGIQVSGKGEPILTSSFSNRDLLKEAISCVWASLYSPEAFLSRKAAHVGVRDADMAVLVQEMLSPELSFVLHIVSPMDDDRVLIALEEDGNKVEIDIEIEIEDVMEVESEDENKDVIEVEIAPGLGAALASGTRATPWRLSYDKTNDTVETLAFANFSEESVVGSGGAADGEVVKLTVDYSKKPLTIDPLFRQQLGRRLGAVGLFLAERLRGRHDVEGCLVGEDIYIVQSRMTEQNKSGNLGGKMGLEDFLV